MILCLSQQHYQQKIMVFLPICLLEGPYSPSFVLRSICPPSFCLLVSSHLSIRGSLFDLLPAPLFWPQSSNPPLRVPKHLRV